MKVLIPEKLAKEGIAVLEQAGVDVTFKPETTPEELVELIPEYDGLIVRSATTVTREVIEAGTNLKVIGRAGVGVDNIDSTAATERGIIVCNAPTSNVVSAAEQTMALMLAVARKTAIADASMKSGKWNRSKFTGVELQDKVLGVFGLGRVGMLVAERAKAFGMKIAGYDPYVTPERAASMGVELYTDINELCKVSDVITVHMPKTKETTGMFGADQYAIMKDGVILVNCARGGIMDINAMAGYLESGKIGGAGIDVWEHEPVSDSPIHGFENVVLTPHLGASTKEAQIRAATQIAEYVIAGMQGKTVNTVVNSARIPENVMEHLRPYVGATQMAADMAAQIADSAIGGVSVKACGRIASEDPSVLGTAALAGIVQFGSEVPVNIINARYLAEQRGIEVETATDPNTESYPSYVEIVAHAADGDVAISVANAPGEQARITNVLGYEVDFIPGKEVVIMQYVDGPGRMGKIGTVLGNAGISIETMQISKNDTDDALVLMNVDRAVSGRIQTDLKNVVNANNAWFIEL